MSVPALLCACNWYHWFNWCSLFPVGQVIFRPPVLDPTVFGFQLFLFSVSFPSFVFSWRDPYQRLFRHSQSLEDRKMKLDFSKLDVSLFHGLDFLLLPTLINPEGSL